MIVDEVSKHWVVFVRPVLQALVGLVLAVAVPFVDLDFAWLVMVVTAGLWAHAGWRILAEHLDRFVITNMRVFRLHGVLARQLATMPLSRILDITVEIPLAGRLLGYGHFCFESAAQEQGLREISFVGRPSERDLIIQRVVQRAGLRGPRVAN